MRKYYLSQIYSNTFSYLNYEEQLWEPQERVWEWERSPAPSWKCTESFTGSGECNLGNQPGCNDIPGNEVISKPCPEIVEEKVGINLLQYTRSFPRWPENVFQKKDLWISLDKSNMKFSADVPTMYLDKNVSLPMFGYLTLY